MTFADLRLAEPILRALAAENYINPTPIQAQAIPPVMEGRDVLGCAPAPRDHLSVNPWIDVRARRH